MNVFGLAVDAVGVMASADSSSPSGPRVCQLYRRRPDVRRRRRVRHDVHPVRRHRVAVYLFAKFSGFLAVLAALRWRCDSNSPRARSLPPLGALLKMRNKHLPGAYCVATAALSIASGMTPSRRPLALGSWPGVCEMGLPAVLSSSSRRYERGGGGVDVEAVRGDDGEEFEFAAQFPAAFAPSVARGGSLSRDFCAGRRPAPGKARTPPPRRTCEGSGGRSRRRRRWRRRDSGGRRQGRRMRVAGNSRLAARAS